MCRILLCILSKCAYLYKHCNECYVEQYNYGEQNLFNTRYMSRVKLEYAQSGDNEKPIKCYLGTNKIHLSTIGVDKAEAYNKMCKLVKRLYNRLPEMRKFLYERGEP